LVQLEAWQEKFSQYGVNVAAMTYDSVATLAAFHQEQQLSYPLLHDANAKHVSALGILNEDYPPGHQAYGIPHPGILFIGSDGVIKAKYAVPGYRRRPPFNMLLSDVEKLTQKP
jgi:peroxiredoxin